MAKQLTFEYEGKAYTLEYTRKSLETMEKHGFSVSDAERSPCLPCLNSLQERFWRTTDTQNVSLSTAFLQI